MIYTDTDESRKAFKESFVAGQQPIIGFWGGYRTRAVGPTCLSQWYSCSFKMDDHEFANAEQAMMYQKAKLFKDHHQMQQILRTVDPKAVKALGRGVIGFKQSVWEVHRFDIVQRVTRAKFSQNEALKEYLLSTNGASLVEASPFDQIWGAGLKADDPRINDPNQWRGLNLLGFVLMNVRDELRKPIQSIREVGSFTKDEVAKILSRVPGVTVTKR